MAGPWEKYAPQKGKPWEKYTEGNASTPEMSFVDALKKAPGAALTQAAAIPGAVYDMAAHPVRTLQGINDLGQGAMSLGARPVNEWLSDRGLTYSRLPPPDEKEAGQMEMARGVGREYAENYGTLKGFKEHLATEPLNIVGDLATVLSGGAGIAGKGPLMASKVPRIAGQTRTSEKLLRNAAPKNPQALDPFGPEAMLLDASPSMTGLAQGVTLAPNAQRNAIVDALLSRDKGRSDRLIADTRSTLGKPRDVELLKKGIDKFAMRKAGPLYTSAKANAPNLSVKNVLLSQAITKRAAGMDPVGREVMTKVMTSVDDALNAGDPKLVAERLHYIRQSLDKRIVYDKQAFDALGSADKAAQAPLKEARAVLDDMLKNNLPGFREADEITAKGKRAQDDVDFGFGALEGGKYAITPKRYAKEYAKRDPKFVAEGVKADVATAMGTQANDLAALRKKVGGDNDFNRDKLAATFGPDKVDSLLSSIDREALFAQNSADISRGSQTAQRLAAAKMAGGPDAPTISDSASFTGLTGKAVAKTLNALMSKATTKYSSRNTEALVKALTAKGPDAQKLLLELTNGKGKSQTLKRIVQAIIGAHVADTVNRPHR